MSFLSTIILLLLVVCRFIDVKNGTMIISNFSRLFAPIKALVSISDTDEHIASSFRLGAVENANLAIEFIGNIVSLS